jgi:hypothetical protein
MKQDRLFSEGGRSVQPTCGPRQTILGGASHSGTESFGGSSTRLEVSGMWQCTLVDIVDSIEDEGCFSVDALGEGVLSEASSLFCERSPMLSRWSQLHATVDGIEEIAAPIRLLLRF